MAHDFDKQSRPALRLLKGGDPEPIAKPSEPVDQPKSPFAQFMKAYADAIDREVRLLLEI